MFHPLYPNQRDSNGNTRRLFRLIKRHLSTHESEAMWQIYSRRNEYMIAIKSTVERLDEALGDKSDNEIGLINYVDHKNIFPAIADSFWYKRESFAHEKEVRAMITSREAIEAKGFFEPVNLERLIEKIVIGPSSPAWFEDLVRSITEKYGCTFDLQRSEMDEERFF